MILSKKERDVSFVIVLLLLIVFTSCSNEDNQHFRLDNSWANLKKMQIIGAHRGLSGYPENSYESVLAAINAGYKVVEIDVARTSDGIFVVHHDATIERCSDGSGKVSDYTYEELCGFNFAHYLGGAFCKIRTLEEILDLCYSKNVAVELDLTNEAIILDEYVEPIYNIVSRKGMLNMILFCGKLNKLQILKSINHTTNVELDVRLKKPEDIDSIISLKSKVDFLYISIPKSQLTNEISKIAHENGVLVESWTCYDEEEVIQCFSKGANYVLMD